MQRVFKRSVLVNPDHARMFWAMAEACEAFALEHVGQGVSKYGVNVTDAEGAFVADTMAEARAQGSKVESLWLSISTDGEQSGRTRIAIRSESLSQLGKPARYPHELQRFLGPRIEVSIESVSQVEADGLLRNFKRILEEQRVAHTLPPEKRLAGLAKVGRFMGQHLWTVVAPAIAAVIAGIVLLKVFGIGG